jgi:hypothetical protein
VNVPQTKVFQIHSDSDLTMIAERMRFGARRVLVKEAPVYAKNNAEMLERLENDYLPRAGDILADPRGAVMLFGAPPGRVGSMSTNFALAYGKAMLISAVSSIDVFDGTPATWHLSLCRINGQPPPVRAPDDVTHRICKAFFEGPYEEGPPEGALKDVRHFRAPWKPN